MGIKLQASLKAYCQRHKKTAGMKLEALLVSDPPLGKDAWIRIRGWYRDVEYRIPPIKGVH